MTEKLTNQQREYEAQQMHRQHLQVRPLSTLSKLSLVTLCGKVVNVNTSYLYFRPLLIDGDIMQNEPLLHKADLRHWRNCRLICMYYKKL